jgi:hypothetical protein
MRRALWMSFSVASALVMFLVLLTFTTQTPHDLGTIAPTPPSPPLWITKAEVVLEDNSGNPLGSSALWFDSRQTDTMPEQIGLDGRIYFLKKYSPPGVFTAEYREIGPEQYKMYPASVLQDIRAVKVVVVMGVHSPQPATK